LFSGVTLGQHEAVTIATDPVDLDVALVETVAFDNSSIYTVPTEIFKKFPNLREFYAADQNIQEVTPDTFKYAAKLRLLTLSQNHLTFLHRDTFKSEYFKNLI
jgi:hypothetical protein